MLKFLKNKKIFRIILTCGDPAGIGPDITVKAIQNILKAEIVFFGDKNILKERAKIHKLPIKIFNYNRKSTPSIRKQGEICVFNIKNRNKVFPGTLDIKNNLYIMQILEKSYSECKKKNFSAIITNPINKSILLKDKKNKFIDHTTFFSTKSKKMGIMMMFNKNIKVAFFTNHIAIKNVSKKVKQSNLIEFIKILIEEVKEKFNIKFPKILVCGLNPHSGEEGYLGKEEKDIIIPAIKKIKRTIYKRVFGPFSADSILHMVRSNEDIIISMYHDQILPAIKYKYFGKITNITLGLPIIRTSVDHGTALQIAGKKIEEINEESLINTIDNTVEILNNL
ncbi:4-hydroxythreonine-4-phosphate dehydrogenase PdxA [bacterium endosymbiont of Pedicinus badii]|uniref:4-hydroxythreonine-4-phosphate dehydrogenase PdxA n=1 Tax=bacterium endosymbiont of Pedicinus badii TaxID=1719126 RepID=UPI0009BB5F11|nr:4-hydroxythreonine-4-phosphate dehydrogenase PdxA [bacterium endosymbiont of Pedicinus badii]OQM34208.1 hypothetical protein AOQ89_02650 [bacterium endosymbiont of Pedicinus badii]